MKSSLKFGIVPKNFYCSTRIIEKNVSNEKNAYTVQFALYKARSNSAN